MLKDPSRSQELSKAIHDVENAGDKITHETIARLHQTWITPIDRSDIHSLITRLDDILDLIEAVSERVLLYGVTKCPDFVIHLSTTVLRATEAVNQAVRLLPRLRQ